MKKKEKVQWCAVAVIVIATAGILWFRGRGTKEEARIWIARPENGTKYETISVTLDEVAEDWTLEVEPRKKTAEEIEEAFSETVRNIYRRLGVEEGGKAVLTESVELPDYDSETGVDIRWNSSEPSVVSKVGTVQRAPLKGPCEITLRACMRYGGESREHWFYAEVPPYEAGSREAVLYQAGEYLSDLEKETQESDGFYLPEAIGEVAVGTKEDAGSVFKWIIAGALFLPLAVVIAKRQEKEQERKKREEECMTAYPQLITKLTLYIGAGLSLRGAWERLAADYRGKTETPGKTDPVEEEVLLLVGELKNGTSEAKAYEEFGRRIGMKPYLRCASLLVSQLQKGSGILRKSLEGEVRLAWELYREQVTKKGEEAQTKLLFPMMGMLFLVMALIMIPAFFAM